MRSGWFPIAKFVWADMNSRMLAVELYEVTDPVQLSRLDALEGHPHWYRRTEVTTASGKLVEVYDMFSQDFEDDCERFNEPGTNLYTWTR